MATILERIIERKRQEVLHLREKKNQFQNTGYGKRSFIKKLKNSDELSIIAEFKRASPSKGVINNVLNPAVQAEIYEASGASAISVLTDQTFFKGSFSDLIAVREAVQLPVLCKDFIIDRLQIDQAASYGADIILLIVAALEKERLLELYQYAQNLGIEVLMEVHNQKELETALKTGAMLIGINNRDLNTFRASLDITEQLAPIVKSSGAFLISESGMHHQEDVLRVKNARADGILVGEAFMKSSDVKQTFLNFRFARSEGAGK